MATDGNEAKAKDSAVRPIYCDECGTQIGRRGNGRLILFGRHHGVKHETVLKIWKRGELGSSL